MTKALVASVEAAACRKELLFIEEQNKSNDGKQCQISASPGFVRRLLSRKQSFLEHLLCFSQQTWLLFLNCNCNRNSFCTEGSARLETRFSDLHKLSECTHISENLGVFLESKAPLSLDPFMSAFSRKGVLFSPRPVSEFLKCKAFAAREWPTLTQTDWQLLLKIRTS